MLKLLFDLEVEDGWPPVAVEGVPCSATPDGYKIESVPLFVKGLSADDEIAVCMSAQGHVAKWSHLRKSGRTTIWLLRILNSAEPGSALADLRRMNCNTVQLPEYGVFAIDVPPELPISEVDAVLSKLDNSRFAVAYPSFRHT